MGTKKRQQLREGLARLMTIQSAAKRAGVSRPLIYRAIDNGCIDVFRVDGQPFILDSDIESIRRS